MATNNKPVTVEIVNGILNKNVLAFDFMSPKPVEGKITNVNLKSMGIEGEVELVLNDSKGQGWPVYFSINKTTFTETAETFDLSFEKEGASLTWKSLTVKK